MGEEERERRKKVILRGIELAYSLPKRYDPIRELITMYQADLKELYQEKMEERKVEMARRVKRSKKESKVFLKIVADFDEVPREDELSDILDVIRQYDGIVLQAKLKISKPQVRDLMKEL